MCGLQNVGRQAPPVPEIVLLFWNRTDVAARYASEIERPLIAVKDQARDLGVVDQGNVKSAAGITSVAISRIEQSTHCDATAI